MTSDSLTAPITHNLGMPFVFESFRFTSFSGIYLGGVSVESSAALPVPAQNLTGCVGPVSFNNFLVTSEWIQDEVIV